ncbi:cell division protein FtsA [Candidatus Pelagibacter sp.]|nr:cell division protein FtsA [Candidatus Pelagibacter sp.]
MSNKKFQTFFDCGFSKIRAGTINIDNDKDVFCVESEFFTDRSKLESQIKKIIVILEDKSDEYINNINLMTDSSEMLSVGISLSKKLDGSKLKQENIKFLVQEAKQQILKYYIDHSIAHIIINNYKIDGTDYSSLPSEIECHSLSLDILFICLPIDLILYFKDIFSKSNISIDQIICTSYAKSISYKNNLSLAGHVSFIDVGFKKTSIISYLNKKIISIDVLPIGGNHITKDISKILEIDMNKSEQAKLNFDQNSKILNEQNGSLNILQEIIFARTEEILDLCNKSIKSNLFLTDMFKMILTGDGSRIHDNKYKDKKFFPKDIVFLEETLEDICQSGFRFISEPNKQEVVVVPKKTIKEGFFEKLFHLFR